MSLIARLGQDSHQDIDDLRRDFAALRSTVELLVQEKDTLRQGVRKLKLENVRMKDKVKRMQTQLRTLTNEPFSDDELLDYDDIGRDFILIGGKKDPLALRFEVTIQDQDKVLHKSAERYYWFKMAKHFGDLETAEKILLAPSTEKAEDVMKNIRGFNEKQWDEVKVDVWQTGQKLKLDQVPWIRNVLMETGSSYIAVAHQDKLFGTGWRKNREESKKPIFWDGKNLGGKFLMMYRKELIAGAIDVVPGEKEEAIRRVADLRRNVWRRIDPAIRDVGNTFRGARGGGRGSRNGGRYMASSFGGRPFS